MHKENLHLEGCLPYSTRRRAMIQSLETYQWRRQRLKYLVKIQCFYLNFLNGHLFCRFKNFDVLVVMSSLSFLILEISCSPFLFVSLGKDFFNFVDLFKRQIFGVLYHLYCFSILYFFHLCCNIYYFLPSAAFEYGQLLPFQCFKSEGWVIGLVPFFFFKYRHYSCNFLSTTLTAFHNLCYVFIFIQFKVFAKFPVISFLTHQLCRSVLLNFHTFMNFPNLSAIAF